MTPEDHQKIDEGCKFYEEELNTLGQRRKPLSNRIKLLLTMGPGFSKEYLKERNAENLETERDLLIDDIGLHRGAIQFRSGLVAQMLIEDMESKLADANAAIRRLEENNESINEMEAHVTEGAERLAEIDALATA